MRKVFRTAHIAIRQDGDYDPEVLAEAKEKGYSQIGIDVRDWYQNDREIRLLRRIGEDASALGLSITVLTGYQRYYGSVLVEHPEWRMVFNDGSAGWEACPFHNDYKALYIEAMRKVAAIPAVEEIQLNDEAHLTDWGDHWACYCDTCARLFEEETGHEPPREMDWDDEIWRRWIKWRFENWVRVHCEIRDAIKATNPDVLLSLQFDPSVCLRGWSPWFSGVDIASLADELDLLRVDPYHVMHSHTFRPDITFVTENVRYLKGAMGGKPVRIWTQGFDRHDFSRALTPADGAWMSVLPVVVGAESVQQWSYDLLQQLPEVCRTYEEAFRFDEYYRQTEPVRHVAVVQGWQTKTWHLNEMVDRRATYDINYFRPACQTLRQAHIPYDHLWDRRLAPEQPAGYKALLLPRVTCLSADQGEALRAFGGGIVATVDTGIYNEEGRPADRQAFSDHVQIGDWRQFGGLSVKDATHPIFEDLSSDALARTNNHGLRVEVRGEANILATFLDEEGADTGLPAIVVSEADQRLVYLAFDPLRMGALDWTLRRNLRDISARLLAGGVRWAAGTEPAVSLDMGAPAGLECFLSSGPGLYVLTLGNYFFYDQPVTARVALPEGARITLAYDAQARRRLVPEAADGGTKLTIDLQGKPVKVVAVYYQG